MVDSAQVGLGLSGERLLCVLGALFSPKCSVSDRTDGGLPVGVFSWGFEGPRCGCNFSTARLTASSLKPSARNCFLAAFEPRLVLGRRLKSDTHRSRQRLLQN